MFGSSWSYGFVRLLCLVKARVVVSSEWGIWNSWSGGNVRLSCFVIAEVVVSLEWDVQGALVLSG